MPLSIRIDVPTESIKLVTGTLVWLSRVYGCSTDLRYMRFGQRLGVDNLFAIPFAVIQLKPYPLGEIASAGVDATRGRFRVGVPHKRLTGCPSTKMCSAALLGRFS